ncbi:MAG: ATPase [Epsilonproteobacteria bacterium]|nr:MAG: ATPase [Campylobacterota bacterium]
MTISLVLQKILKIIDKQLAMTDINEILIDDIGYVKVKTSNYNWKIIKNANIDEAFLNDFPKELATWDNQHFGDRNTYLSSKIPNTNNRVGVVHHSLVQSSHNVINIRIQNKKKFELKDFISEEDMHYIKELIELIKANKNILISGGTGSGKTSLFNALLMYIALNHRIVTIEDSGELDPPHKNVTALMVAKNGNSLSGVTYEDMINISMRLNGDNILLGEIDTRNTLAYLRLCNTGHDGNMATIHSNSPEDSVTALVTNIMMSGTNSSSLEGIYNYIDSAIDVVVQIDNHGITTIKPMKKLVKKLRAKKIKSISTAQKLSEYCRNRNWKSELKYENKEWKICVYNIFDKDNPLIILKSGTFKTQKKAINSTYKNLIKENFEGIAS